MKYLEFGWNGFLFEMPDNMHFRSEGGNLKKGSMMLESEQMLMEIRWEPFNPDKLKPIEEVVEELTKEMEKSKKRKIKILSKARTQVFRHDAFLVNVRSDVNEKIFMWYCDESKRFVIYRFAFGNASSQTRIMKHILGSIECHNENTYTWKVLGFNLQLPTAFDLTTDHKMAVGRSHFIFIDQKNSPLTTTRKEVLLEYFSIANLVYKDTYRKPELWLQENYQKDLKKRYGKIKSGNPDTKRIRRHRAVYTEWKRTSGFATRTTSYFANATWYCSGSNRMYSLTMSNHVSRLAVFNREIDEKEFEDLSARILESIICH